MGKRLTLFAGHYGSGKTNIALNYARRLKESSAAEVCIADLDIVNPYFRTKDSAADLEAAGIRLVVSEFANSNVDFPALPKEIYALTAPQRPVHPSSNPPIPQSPNRTIEQSPNPPIPQSPNQTIEQSNNQTIPLVVMDIGGDDRGALALGRYVPDIKAENDYEMLAVVNASRPLTRTPEDTVEVLREIESACQLPFTGIVNNTNLGKETTAADVLASLPYAESVARLMSISVRFTCAPESLVSELEGKVPDLFPLRIQKLYYQLGQ